MSADAIIAKLKLRPHPEGGWYTETWAGPGQDRASGTCIYFLLKAGEQNMWHRVDATEIWHFYAGAPLILSIAETTDGPALPHVLGPDVLAGMRPQVVVQAQHWQSACTTGGFSLVGCTVSPGFRFEGFELLPPGVDIPR